MAKKISIVGAGFTGLCSAALLAKDGYTVEIFERNSSPGGRARLWEKDGFAFDMGPSWYLMPEVFDHFFSLFGKKREAYWTLNKLDTYYKVFFGNGESAEIKSDFNKTRALFERFEKGGAQRLDDYVETARYKYKVAIDDFLYRDYTSILQFLNKRLMTEGLKLNVFDSLDRYVSRYFSDTRAKQILEYAMVFLGASPLNAPALYSLMSYLDLADGVYFPEGGMYAIVEGLVKLCSELGVQIHYENDVTELVVNNKQVQGLKLKQQPDGNTLFIPSDSVLVCSDYAHAEMNLLAPEYRTYGKNYWEKSVLAPGMLIAYLGMKEKIEGIAHHNLYFASDWNAHFDSIFKKPAWPDDPCFYLSAASKTEKRAAPQGKENLFLLIPLAPGLEDTDEIREVFFERNLAKVESVIGKDLRSKIEFKRLFSHRDFSGDYNAYKGSALGLAHTLKQTAVFRPALRSKKVKNLYFAGQYTHPGVGVPMTFIAAELAASIIKEESAL